VDGGIDELRTALDRSDRRWASQLLERLSSTGRADDDALDLLASRAADDPLARELLIGVLDDTGLARAAVGRVLLNESAVEDVTQDVLVAVVRSVRGFRGDARFRTWLFQLARNQAVDHLRRERATTPLDDHDVGEAQRMSSIIATRLSARLLVERLQEPYRSAVALRDLDQWTYEDIAEHLGVGEATVRSRVARGRALLAGAFPSDAPGAAR
jgi:RNA polymerase sigma-70 factor, ECF subfamily